MVNSLLKRTTAIIIALGVAPPVAADPSDGGLYLRAFGGASSLSDADLSGVATGTSGFDTGQVFGGAIGYDFARSPFRSEVEYAYRTGDADGSVGIMGDFASTTLALNGYYDFAPVLGGRLKPYVGGGLAYITEIDFDITGGSAPGEYKDSGGFGYQLMLGAEYPVSERWSVTGEVRYFDAGNQTLSGLGGSISADYETVDVIIGTSFKF